MCKCLCEPCFLQHPLVRCVGRHITVNNIRDERINNTAWAHWQLTNDMCSGNVRKCHRVCVLEGGEASGVCSVCLSNGLISGSREIDDLVKISCLFFAPLYKGLLYVYLCLDCPLLSLFFLPSHLCRLLRPSLFSLSHRFSLARCSSQPLLSKGWDGSLPSQKMAAVHCSFCLHSALHSAFPRGACRDLTVMERTDGGWITCCQKWGWHSKHCKNNNTKGSPVASYFYCHCKEGWISRDTVSKHMCQSRTHGQFQFMSPCAARIW